MKESTLKNWVMNTFCETREAHTSAVCEYATYKTFSTPHSGLGFKAKVYNPFYFVPCSLGSGWNATRGGTHPCCLRVALGGERRLPSNRRLHQAFGFGVCNLGFRVWSLGFMVGCLESGLWGVGFWGVCLGV